MRTTAKLVALMGCLSLLMPFLAGCAHNEAKASTSALQAKTDQRQQMLDARRSK